MAPVLADPITRRIIAAILGLIGVVLLIDVLVIALLVEHPNFDGVRQVLFVIIGALLVLGGAITFAWPQRGDVRTTEDDGKPQSP